MKVKTLVSYRDRLTGETIEAGKTLEVTEAQYKRMRVNPFYGCMCEPIAEKPKRTTRGRKKKEPEKEPEKE